MNSTSERCYTLTAKLRVLCGVVVTHTLIAGGTASDSGPCLTELRNLMGISQGLITLVYPQYCLSHHARPCGCFRPAILLLLWRPSRSVGVGGVVVLLLPPPQENNNPPPLVVVLPPRSKRTTTSRPAPKSLPPPPQRQQQPPPPPLLFPPPRPGEQQQPALLLFPSRKTTTPPPSQQPPPQRTTTPPHPAIGYICFFAAFATGWRGVKPRTPLYSF